MFGINIIVESFHKVLNQKFIGFCKTMINFKNALTGIICLYEMKNN